MPYRHSCEGASYSLLLGEEVEAKNFVLNIGHLWDVCEPLVQPAISRMKEVALMRRILLVFALGAMMVMMVAAPAFATVIHGAPGAGPPAETGHFPSGATVTHCQSLGGEGTFVFNKNDIQGPGNCLE